MSITLNTEIGVYTDENGVVWTKNGEVRYRAQGPLVFAESFVNEETGEVVTQKVIEEEAPDPFL